VAAAIKKENANAAMIQENESILGVIKKVLSVSPTQAQALSISRAASRISFAMRYDTKVQSRGINPDGTMTIFVVIDSQETESYLPSISTEPELDIVRYEPHFKNGKFYSLTLHVGAWPDLVEGSPLTIILDE
jgi:hypothetical protein